MKNDKTWHLKLASIIMAILLWFFVTNESLIINEHLISGVRVHAINIGSELVASYPNEVGVSIVGTPRTANEINAFVDLKGKEVGVYRLPVKVTAISGTRISKVTPAEITVEVTRNQQVLFPVSYRTAQPLAEGLEVAAMEITPARCAVRGGENEVAKVVSLEAVLDLSKVEDTVSIRVPVTPLDAEGNRLDAVEILPAQVQVYVVVNKVQAVGKANVNPVINGAPEEGFVVREVIVEPRQVSLMGPEKDVSRIVGIDTKAVDVTGRKESFHQETDLVQVERVTVVPSRVLCWVEIIPEE